jgi:hypothetical protein
LNNGDFESIDWLIYSTPTGVSNFDNFYASLSRCNILWTIFESDSRLLSASTLPFQRYVDRPLSRRCGRSRELNV